MFGLGRRALKISSLADLMFDAASFGNADLRSDCDAAADRMALDRSIYWRERTILVIFGIYCAIIIRVTDKQKAAHLWWCFTDRVGSARHLWGVDLRPLIDARLPVYLGGPTPIDGMHIGATFCAFAGASPRADLALASAAEWDHMFKGTSKFLEMVLAEHRLV